MRVILSVAEQVAILFLLAGVGLAASKARLFGRTGAAELTNLAFFIATPCAIVKAFTQVEATAELWGDLGRAALLAVFATVLGLLCSRFLFRKQAPPRRSVLGMAAAFPNCGFMGIPLASALLGSESVAYLSMYMVVFHLFTWTAGVRMFKPETKTSLRAMLLNPGVLGLAGGALTLLWGRALPGPIAVPIDALAALNTPLAMLVMGFHMGASPLRPAKDGAVISLAVFVRQGMVPLVVLGAARLLGLGGLWFMAAMVACAAPCAVNTVMFAQKFDADAPLGAALLTCSNLAALVTMPLLLGLCFQFFA